MTEETLEKLEQLLEQDVRGAWKTDTEYIHKLRIERYQK